MTTDKAAILEAYAVKPVEFPSPGKPTILLRPWFVAERIAFLEWVKGNTDRAALYRRLLAESICDESGKLLFTEGELVSFDGAEAERIASKVAAMNGITGADPKKDTSAKTPK